MQARPRNPAVIESMAKAVGQLQGQLASSPLTAEHGKFGMLSAIRVSNSNCDLVWEG